MLPLRAGGCWRRPAQVQIGRTTRPAAPTKPRPPRDAAAPARPPQHAQPGSAERLRYSIDHQVEHRVKFFEAPLGLREVPRSAIGTNTRPRSPGRPRCRSDSSRTAAGATVRTLCVPCTARWSGSLARSVGAGTASNAIRPAITIRTASSKPPDPRRGGLRGRVTASLRPGRVPPVLDRLPPSDAPISACSGSKLTPVAGMPANGPTWRRCTGRAPRRDRLGITSCGAKRYRQRAAKDRRGLPRTPRARRTRRPRPRGCGSQGSIGFVDGSRRPR